MSENKVANYVKRAIVYPIVNITDHPTLQHLIVGQVGGHQVVTGRHYDEGQLGVFFPHDAIIPDNVAEEMWVKGKLAGNQKNRVKVSLRGGVLSEGLFYGSQGVLWNPEWREGDDVTDVFGITFRP